MKIGIIGTGNMGTILTESLLKSGAVSPADIILTNRTIEKAHLIRKRYEGIAVTKNVEKLITDSDLMFICLKPLDIVDFLQRKGGLFKKEQCVVSITSPISVEWLETFVSASCMRIIPSITNRALAGVSLFTFGDKCEKHWKEDCWDLFSHVSSPLEIKEETVRVSSDIVSCGPAFISFLVRGMINAAVSETKISTEDATKLSENMLIGLGELLKQGYYSLPALEEKVCVKGGITGEGIAALEEEKGEMFEKLFRATHKKFADEVKHIQSKMTVP